MRDGILEELVDAVKALREAVVAQTEVIKKQTSVQASEKRQRLTVDVSDVNTRLDLTYIFDQLFAVQGGYEVTRGDIMRNLEECKTPGIRRLIDSYNLTKVQSKGYRAFIEIARGKARREFFRDGSQILSGIVGRKDLERLERLDPPLSLKALQDEFHL